MTANPTGTKAPSTADEHIFSYYRNTPNLQCSCGSVFGSIKQAEQHKQWILQLKDSVTVKLLQSIKQEILEQSIVLKNDNLPIDDKFVKAITVSAIETVFSRYLK